MKCSKNTKKVVTELKFIVLKIMKRVFNYTD